MGPLIDEVDKLPVWEGGVLSCDDHVSRVSVAREMK